MSVVLDYVLATNTSLTPGISGGPGLLLVHYVVKGVACMSIKNTVSYRVDKGTWANLAYLGPTDILTSD